MSANAPSPKDQQPQPKASALSSLRNLLLGDEKVALSRVSEDLEALRAKYEDQERFRHSVAEVLADALTDARSADQGRLSRAISPIVAASIKREIVNSKDEMVEALYPITGRLVAASVRNSITKLGEEINERIERMFSFRGMLTRWRAQITGGNTADMILANTQKAVIQRAMIIERGSGVLIGQWQANDPNQQSSGDSDMDLVSGLLSAISSLADEAFGGENTELRTLDLNGSQVALRRSPKYIVALEFTGVLSANERLKLDAAFAECIERLIDRNEAGAFEPFTSLSTSKEDDHLQDNRDAAQSEPALRKYGKMAIGFAVVGLLALSIWQWVAGRNLETDIGKIQAVLNADQSLDGFPIMIEPLSDGGLSIKGLYPMRLNVANIQQRVQSAVGNRTVRFDLKPVADARDIDALQREISRLRQGMAR